MQLRMRDTERPGSRNTITNRTAKSFRSLGKRVAEHSGAAEQSVRQTLDISRDPSTCTGDLHIDVKDGAEDTDSHAGQSNNESVSSIKTQSGKQSFACMSVLSCTSRCVSETDLNQTTVLPRHACCTSRAVWQFCKLLIRAGLYAH